MTTPTTEGLENLVTGSEIVISSTYKPHGNSRQIFRGHFTDYDVLRATINLDGHSETSELPWTQVLQAIEQGTLAAGTNQISRIGVPLIGTTSVEAVWLAKDLDEPVYWNDRAGSQQALDEPIRGFDQSLFNNALVRAIDNKIIRPNYFGADSADQMAPGVAIRSEDLGQFKRDLDIKGHEGIQSRFALIVYQGQNSLDYHVIFNPRVSDDPRTADLRLNGTFGLRRYFDPIHPDECTLFPADHHDINKRMAERGGIHLYAVNTNINLDTDYVSLLKSLKDVRDAMGAKALNIDFGGGRQLTREISEAVRNGQEMTEGSGGPTASFWIPGTEVRIYKREHDTRLLLNIGSLEGPNKQFYETLINKSRARLLIEDRQGKRLTNYK